MEVVACIGVLALSGHVGFANLGIFFALFATGDSAVAYAISSRVVAYFI